MDGLSDPKSENLFSERRTPDPGSIFHDGRDPLALSGQDRNVVQRIAIDDEQVGEGATGHHAEFALHANDLGADRRGLADRFERSDDVGTNRQFIALKLMYVAEQVRP